ncbi:hypothetical protein B0H13DRAFT_1877338 [Mycena leptocephala]|nr:hypothetical protein B0H13DRAFT_1877338 [Mycena leptocephala]
MITLLSLCLAICICAEQTFSKVSAKKAAFSPVFSAALDTYLASSLQDDINREISTLSDLDYETKEFVDQLVNIIKSHPLPLIMHCHGNDFWRRRRYFLTLPPNSYYLNPIASQEILITTNFTQCHGLRAGTQGRDGGEFLGPWSSRFVNAQVRGWPVDCRLTALAREAQ